MLYIRFVMLSFYIYFTEFASCKFSSFLFTGGCSFDENINLACCVKDVKQLTVGKRFYGTRTNKPLSSKHTANQFVRWLLPEERASLFIALKEFEAEEGILEQKKGKSLNHCDSSLIYLPF